MINTRLWALLVTEKHQESTFAGTSITRKIKLLWNFSEMNTWRKTLRTKKLSKMKSKYWKNWATKESFGYRTMVRMELWRSNLAKSWTISLTSYLSMLQEVLCSVYANLKVLWAKILADFSWIKWLKFFLICTVKRLYTEISNWKIFYWMSKWTWRLLTLASLDRWQALEDFWRHYEVHWHIWPLK